MPAEAPTLIAIDRELAQLARSPIAVLRARWLGEFRCEPPPAFGPDLLRRSLAYKLQEDAYGKHPAATQRELDRLVTALEQNPTARAVLQRRVKPGSVLVRDWKGKSHRVTVLDRALPIDGKTYTSLSEIARQITGTRWNGPRFFGLRASATHDAEASTNQLRCAIYTRKSTEHGLELEFNSLDAQREACEAYIKSQGIEGWTALANAL